MPERPPTTSKRPRGAYSRLICLGCRERRIKCELPDDVDIPDLNELRTVTTPCYRCEKLGIDCVVRRTRLGRPGHGDGSIALPAPAHDETRLEVNSTIDQPPGIQAEDVVTSLHQPHMSSKPPLPANERFMIPAKIQILPMRRSPVPKISPATSEDVSSSGNGQTTTTKRTRASKPKIKCDETKPSCLKCSSTGRKCDGYSSQDLTKSKDSINTTNAARPTRGLALSPLKASTGEMRALEYFCVKTAPGLGMYFDADFWNSFMVQASVAEPALRYAMVALGILAEQRELRDIGDAVNFRGTHLTDEDSAVMSVPTRITETDPVALRSYNNSVSLLSKMVLSPGTTDKILLACILFICIELLRGDTEAAVNHFRGGMAIITDHMSRVGGSPSTRSMSDQVSNRLLPFFNRLEMLYALDGYDASWQYPTTLSESIPVFFVSLEHARDSLVNLLNLSLRFVRSMGLSMYKTSAIPALALEEQMALLSQLLLWRQLLSAYQAKHGSHFTSKELYACNVLEIQRLVAYTWVSVATSPFETAHDLHIQAYTAAVSLAEQLPALASAHTQSSRYINTFTADVELVGPIHWVAINCREPSVRRRAIAVLRGLHRREGLWDSRMAAAIAERVVAIEEAGLVLGDGEPSEEARVHYSFTDSWAGVASDCYSITHRLKPGGVWGEWEDRVEHFTLR